MRHYKYLIKAFDPGPLGSSLVVDLNPNKKCTFDCIFCENGPTECKTMVRREYAPFIEIVDELQDWRKRDGKAKYVVLSGNGETTLNSCFNEVINYVHQQIHLPVLLTTNGALLYKKDVCESAVNADIVKISLSAWDHESFNFINRPHFQLYFFKIIDGILNFRQKFKNELWLELVLLWGIHSLDSNIQKISELLKLINPGRILFKTAGRFCSEDYAKPLPENLMNRLAHILKTKTVNLKKIKLERDDYEHAVS